MQRPARISAPADTRTLIEIDGFWMAIDLACDGQHDGTWLLEADWVLVNAPTAEAIAFYTAHQVGPELFEPGILVSVIFPCHHLTPAQRSASAMGLI